MSSSWSGNQAAQDNLDDPHRNRILAATSRDDYEIVADTLDWLQHVVMGLNLCPFAKPSFSKDQIQIEVEHGENPTDILARVVEECFKLKRDDAEGTTLVVCPDLFPDDFEEFLGILNVLEEGILEDLDLTGVLQIAPFHPRFVFGDQKELDGDKDTIESYTNRAPYPIFHILREVEVAKAVEALEGDASKVWQRNIELLRSLEDEFSVDLEDGNKLGTDLVRSIILKGKINGHVQNEATRGDLRKRIQRVMKKLKLQRLA